MAMEPPRKRNEWPEWEEARGREEDAWRLEPVGETEVPETVIVADEVEGTCMASTGEGHGRGKVQNHRSQSGAQGEEGEEIKVEKLSFVPSAVSVPQKLLFRCDNQCSEKTLSFWEFASVVVCQKCYNESLKAKGEKH